MKNTIHTTAEFVISRAPTIVELRLFLEWAREWGIPEDAPIDMSSWSGQQDNSSGCKFRVIWTPVKNES